MTRIIKRYNIEGEKVKLILDVYWQHLKGNKLPYLSSNNIRLIVNNKAVWFGRDEYKGVISSIKSIDQEVATLLNSHLCTTDGGDIHQVANTLYYLEKARSDAFFNGRTKEDLQEEIDQLYDQWLGDLKKNLNKLRNSYLLTEGQDLCDFIYKKMPEKLDHRPIGDYIINHRPSLKGVEWFICQFVCKENHTIRGFKAKLEDQEFCEFLGVDTLDSVIKLIGMYRKAPNKKDIYTIDRFCEYANIDLGTAKEWLFTIKSSEDMAKKLEPIRKNNKKLLNQLTETYKIETITK